MAPPLADLRLSVFSSELGWIALVGAGDVLCRLSFGHRAPDAAVAALEPELGAAAIRAAWNPELVDRLKAYAAGEPVDFGDVVIDERHLSPFGRRVIRRCRRIPYGRTMSYGELAAAAGSPRAARAVGNCMAGNRTPLVVPCHRVVAAQGRLGRFSAPGGTRTKRRLLAMEGRAGAPVRL
jgi:methylated-DNA-[protein]-cysteine S-methyltransferase